MVCMVWPPEEETKKKTYVKKLWDSLELQVTRTDSLQY